MRLPSGQCAMPSSSTRRADARVTSSPSKTMRPALAVSTPDIAFNVVVFPPPLTRSRLKWGRLAGGVSADRADEFALFALERQIAHGRHFAIAAFEFFNYEHA